MSEKITIEKGVPLPPGACVSCGRLLHVDFFKMEVSDSMVVNPGWEWDSQIKAGEVGIAIFCKVEDGKCRVWRVA